MFLVIDIDRSGYCTYSIIFLLFFHSMNVLGTYYVLCRHGQSARDMID